jgi:hypothetical protein
LISSLTHCRLLARAGNVEVELFLLLVVRETTIPERREDMITTSYGGWKLSVVGSIRGAEECFKKRGILVSRTRMNYCIE